VLWLLQDLSHEDLLTEAAGMAPVAAWRKAATAAAASAAAATGTTPHPRRSNSREGSSSPRGQGARSLRQQVQTLWQIGRKALRASVVAIHLLQQQQQCQDADGAEGLGALPRQYTAGLGAAVYRMKALLNHLAVMLQDQASCLSPWFEPWRFKPPRTPLRLLMLQAAQVRDRSWWGTYRLSALSDTIADFMPSVTTQVEAENKRYFVLCLVGGAPSRDRALWSAGRLCMHALSLSGVSLMLLLPQLWLSRVRPHHYARGYGPCLLLCRMLCYCCAGITLPLHARRG
jgi:hypothetical protein